jgi:hypothetical protein
MTVSDQVRAPEGPAATAWYALSAEEIAARLVTGTDRAPDRRGQPHGRAGPMTRGARRCSPRPPSGSSGARTLLGP